MSIRVASHGSCRNITQQLPPIFLAPLLATNPFSTSTAHHARHKPFKKRRDGNVHRGESALRRTGLRFPVAMSSQPLPKPVLDPKRRSKVQTDPNHGLWGFFNSEKKPLTPPREDSAYGRAWTVEELRQKSWEDLHSLWYICCKDRNRMATEGHERRRLKLRAGSAEPKGRELTIRRTQQRIKYTLTERWYTWEDAWKAAEKDPEVNLNAEPDTSAYSPRNYEEVEELDEVPRAASAVG